MESMTAAADVVIVSAFGRGNWLAGELARQGWRVTLVDATAALGAWETEDWEGPWGYFEQPDLLSPTQLERLEQAAEVRKAYGATSNSDGSGSRQATDANDMDSGFTCWLPRGPLTFSGALAGFHSRSFAIPEAVRDYLQPLKRDGSDGAGNEGESAEAQASRAQSAVSAAPIGPVPMEPAATAAVPPASPNPVDLAAAPQAGALSGGSPSWLATLGQPQVRRPDRLQGLERWHRQVRKLSFEQSWLANLAHAASACVYSENVDSLEQGRPMALYAPYRVRYVNRESEETAFLQLEKAGVRVIRNASIVDVRLRERCIDAIEVAAERRGVQSARSFVWLLSGLETRRFPKNVQHSLFASGPCEAAWAWTRFRFHLKSGTASRQLPAAFLYLENIHLPWTHANLAWMKRAHVATRHGNEATRADGGENGVGVALDAWLRVPARVLGDTPYFESLAEELRAGLERRLPLSAPVCASLPLEAHRERLEQAALRFPIYDKKQLESRRPAAGKNYFFDGPEFWDGWDWVSQMRHQSAVLAALKRLRAKWEAADRRMQEAGA